MDEKDLNALILREQNEPDQENQSVDIKWQVSKLCIEFEKYDNLKDKCEEVEDELEEFDEDDSELDREDRLNKKKLKMRKKYLLRLINEQEELLVNDWDSIKDDILNDEYMKTVSDGDTYFMTSLFRVRKEHHDMLSQEE